MTRPLAVGDMTHGFCQGYFGRDLYQCTTVEARGVDWAVFRTTDGAAAFVSGNDLHKLAELRDEEVRPEEHSFGCPLHTDDEPY